MSLSIQSAIIQMTNFVNLRIITLSYYKAQAIKPMHLKCIVSIHMLTSSLLLLECSEMVLNLQSYAVRKILREEIWGSHTTALLQWPLQKDPGSKTKKVLGLCGKQNHQIGIKYESSKNH